jgi:N-acetylglucosamine kinase-like BadF-type ATPase
LGVDVGATKSHALIADDRGQALGLGAGGPGNPDDVGHEGLAQVLSVATDEALAAAGITSDEIAGAGFGVSGYDWPSQRASILQAIDVLGLVAPVELVNDTVIALVAGAADGWGVAVVAGTSCNCWGWDRQRRVGRMTGYSWLGEGAGANELVLKAIQAVALEWTRRGPPTRLSATFVELAGAQDVAGFLEGLSLGHIRLGPDVAPVVFRVAAEGDAVAQELVLWAGRELGSMANGVVRQLGLETAAFDVVLAGSFFKGSPLLAEAMRKVIHTVAPDARLVRLHVPPVVGAVLLGMEQAGVELAPLREPLITSTAGLLRKQG